MNTPPAPIPYWKERNGIAPIKAEYVVWEKMRSRPEAFAEAADVDDALEGRGGARRDGPMSRNDETKKRLAVLKEDLSTAPIEQAPSTTASNGLVHAPPSPTAEPDAKKARIDGDALIEMATTETAEDVPVKKVRLSGAQKKAARRAAEDAIWDAKRAQREKDKAAGIPKTKGQNKGRSFDRRAGEQSVKLCLAVATGRECGRVVAGTCRWDHDLISYLADRLVDIPLLIPTDDNDLTSVTPTPRLCPLFAALGQCPQGFKCRFGLSHMTQVPAGEGTAGSEWVLVVDADKVEKLRLSKGVGVSEIREKGEMNVITMERIKEIRGQGVDRDLRFPLTVQYLTSVGEPIDLRELDNKGAVSKRAKKDEARAKVAQQNPGVYVVHESYDDEPMLPAVASTSTLPRVDIDSHPSRSFVPDLAPIRAGEKKTLDFRNKLYLAPLTTVGNLPFRRLCGTFGNDISCSEMGLSTEFLNGNSSEWSLVRRHPSEKMFGIQVCGSRPQSLVPTAEAIVKSCDVDFIDVNCGCPIDLVFNKGAGSALLQHATRLGKSLVGMSQVMGDIPLTIKIRTGITNTTPVAHKLVTKMQSEWGLSAVTLHGRSRQQRYKTKADYAYIAQCAATLRETAADQGLKPIPIFGNGDAYDYRTYYENMEASGVDGIMIARGALVKPWIFTEIKERRDWDISSRERLDMIGKLAEFGIEHWGSDTLGLNTARRFLCEALSFQHRYVPVGLLEHLPAQLNDRAFPYRGRDELETLLASDQAADWVKLTSMFMGPPPDDWNFTPKHKSASGSDSTEGQG